MASAHAIALSSPSSRGFLAPTTPSGAQHAVSSSPGLPSLSDILNERMPRSPDQEKAPDDLGNASFRFTSARSLPRNEDLPRLSNAVTRIESTSFNRGSDERDTHADSEKRRVEHGISEHSKTRRRSKLGSTPKSPGDIIIMDNEFHDGNDIESGRKKRTKKPRKDDQTRIMKAKIKKPRSNLKTSKHPKNGNKEGNRAIVDSRRNPEPIINDNSKKSNAYNESDLGLNEAQQRRKDWTPVKDTSKAWSRTSEIEAVCPALLPAGSSSPLMIADGVLLKRLGEYGFGGTDQAVFSRPRSPRDLNAQPVTKKHKLNLVAGIAPTGSKAIVSKRSKSPRKKQQTITDKATAPFAFDGEAGASTIRNYFPNAPQGTSPGTFKLGPQHEASKLGTDKHDQPGKIKSSKPKAKKKSKEIPMLHSPGLAVREANSQDLVFGTCSQLAREESPIFIRDLQQAFRESEAIDESQPLLQGQDSQLSAKSASSSSSTTRLPAGARNLWSVAARNDEGHLLDVEFMNLVDSPQVPCSFQPEPDIGSIEKEKSIAPSAVVDTTAVDTDWRTIDSLVIEKAAASPHLIQQEVDNALPRSVAEASLRARPRNQSPIKKSSHRTNQKLSTIAGNSNLAMPNYKGYTDVDLKTAVSKTGFKAMRKRETRISHLEECWYAEQSRKGLQANPADTCALATSSNVRADEATKPGSPVKKRGRPRKIASSVDGENGAATRTVPSKKPRGRPKKDTSGSPITSTSPVKAYLATDSLQQDSFPLPGLSGRDGPVILPAPHKMYTTSTRVKTAQRFAPFLATITVAVMNYPPTHNAQNLTPYEKMLLYDPVVLEDFAQWLNNEGLKHVGCDETVDPTIAKLWCESQSVCCLWRENLRGGTRARY
ncbi:MAG: hypothetical protein Q9169_000475 [Polycauliona sp. 2 TL-2023]